MSAIRVPKSVLARVERSLRGGSAPLLWPRRSETDTPLEAVPHGDGRYHLVVGTESAWATMLALIAVLSDPPNPAERIALALTRAAATGMRDMPRQFTDDSGRVVARFEVEDTLVTIHGARALSLVAWMLSGRRKRTGFHLVLDGD